MGTLTERSCSDLNACPADQRCDEADVGDGFRCSCTADYSGSSQMNGNATCEPLVCDEDVDDDLECGVGATCDDHPENRVSIAFATFPETSRGRQGTTCRLLASRYPTASNAQQNTVTSRMRPKVHASGEPKPVLCRNW